MEDIDGRAESSFNPRDVYFPDYDANQLRQILENRRDAFRSDALTDDVLPLVSAFAAQSHGDARKAIDLFRGAGDLADERGDEKVREEHVRESQGRNRQGPLTEVNRGSDHPEEDIPLRDRLRRPFLQLVGSSVPSPVGFKVYQWITDEIDADQMTRETYVQVRQKSSPRMVSSRPHGRVEAVVAECTWSSRSRGSKP